MYRVPTQYRNARSVHLDAMFARTRLTAELFATVLRPGDGGASYNRDTGMNSRLKPAPPVVVQRVTFGCVACGMNVAHEQYSAGIRCWFDVRIQCNFHRDTIGPLYHIHI